MSLQQDLTTLVCLFHHRSSADSAIRDLLQAGISETDITRIGGPEAEPDALEKSELASLGMPDRDYDHLKEGVRQGGFVVAVSQVAESRAVEEIFHKHSADKIDETAPISGPDDTPAAAPFVAPLTTTPLAAAEGLTAERAIPVVAEELVVGKRTVDAGGVRVFRRVVEIPVEEQITLREEHVDVDRRMVDRPATDADLAFGERTIELRETAEEAVVGKTARVVEEVLVGKQSTERTETISDTVRHTEVDVEELAPGTADRARQTR